MKELTLDLTTMNDFEIKGLLLSLIEKAKRNQLIQVAAFLKENTASLDDDIDNSAYALNAEQEAELQIAIEETYHKENLITHNEALNELSRWLHK